MLLFMKGFIVGIGKMIPGLSGAMLAINFNVYEKAILAITDFFHDWKGNLKFLLIFGIGVLLSIILCSELILYLFRNYRFVMMLLFIGLLLGGTYNFGKKIVFNLRNNLIIIGVMVIFLLFSIYTTDNIYVIRENFYDNIVFFFGGVIEVFSSIVPGISGTSLLLLLGIYHHVLYLFGNIYNFEYVLDNINIYFSYGIGMFISLVVNAILIKYLFKNYRDITNVFILSLSLASILFLLITNFRINFSLLELIVGIMLFTVGLLISSIFSK